MGVPGDVILEPRERVLVATRPLVLWEPLALIALALFGGTLWLYRADPAGSWWLVTLGIAVAYALILIVKWIAWRVRWFILTDRRVIARRGVFNRSQVALLLDRIQDASLMRPFPASLWRDYGVIHIESAGELSDEKISGGLSDLKMTGASRFYRALTDAQTPHR